MQEANEFMIECFDQEPIPDADEFFNQPVSTYVMGFTGPFLPPRMAHVMESYSVLEPVDEYTFHVVRHELEFFACEMRRAEKRDIQRTRRTRRERLRLGFTPFPGSSNAEIRESRPTRCFTGGNIEEGYEPYPHEM